MHGDSACEAIFSLLFLPLDPFPFSSLRRLCYWKGFWQEGLHESWQKVGLTPEY